ncbi:MAG: menaquinone biosynthesis protein [Aquificaceae bacterium]
MVKVGKVKYLNTMPLFYRWDDPSIELIEGHPSELACKLREGEFQAGIVSSVEYIMNRELYEFVPNISVSSKRRVCSVLFLSKVPIESIRKVYITPHSLSSKYLSFYIFEEVLKVRPDYVKEKDQADCLMLIGDEALTEKKEGKYAYVYDLGEMWYKKNKLPFVFALFIVRKDAPKGLLPKITEMCQASKEAFFDDLKNRKIKVEGFTQEELLEYFTHCLYNGLDKKSMLSLEIFTEFLTSKGYAKIKHRRYKV